LGAECRIHQPKEMVHMSWQKQLNGDSLAWLLEPEDPGVCFLALRDLQGCASKDTRLSAARKRAHTHGPIAAVLSQMAPEGYWVQPGPGYDPKYRSTVWAIVLLAQLGASIHEDKRLQQACNYVLNNALTEGGQFTATGTPSGTADCLQGNLLWALLELGSEDPRLEQAYDWMARTVTGEGIAPVQDRHGDVRYYAGKCGPTFACGANNKLPCAWGAAKVMLALGKCPKEWRSPVVERATASGIDFLFSVDPADATYPSGWANKPSGNWWKFGFPVFYVTDLLQIAEALVALGHGNDRRLARTLELIRQKQDASGRWSLEYDYTGKTWVEFGAKKQPNKWVTLRTLRVLKAVGAG
jgi:hypothetical protein